MEITVQAMPVIRVELSRNAYEKLTQARKKAGLPNSASYLLQRAGLLDTHAAGTEIARTAYRRALKVTRGEPFTVKGLFSEPEWDGFSRDARIRAGKTFFQRVSQEEDEGGSPIRILGKNSSNHQLYERK